MRNIFVLISCIAFLISNLLTAQVTTDPAVPIADQSVTIILDATGTGLEGYTGNVYAHTGITKNGAQWQNVIGDWGVNSSQPLLINIDTDLYKLEITPTIREFYSAGSEDDITEICIVFRSAEEPYLQTMPDIFIEVFEIELNIVLISPDISPFFVEPGETITVTAESMLSDLLSLYVDDVLITSTSGTMINETITASTDQDTKHWIRVVATEGENMVADSNYYYVRGENTIEDLPEGVVDGINYIDEQTVTLVLQAPYKNSIYAIGDFNDWSVDPEFRLKCNMADNNNIETRYWVTLENLTPGQEYIFQYLVDESIKIGDPYAEKVSDPWNDQYINEATYPGMLDYPDGLTDGIATVLQTNQEEYMWQVENFQTPAVEDMVVYELLIRDFTAQHTFQSLIDTIGYFKRLGINVIELMPVNEFEGNSSWGYNPNYYFAVDKYYGPKNDLKAFIDECHANEIAVVIDMVLNHSFGTSPMVLLYWDAQNNQPAANNLWFNQQPTHDYNVGYDFNHESPQTREFTKRVNDFWLTEFNVDGFRFDLSKGFTQTYSVGNIDLWGQYDQSRINIWNDYAAAIWQTNPDARIILEHFAENPEEIVLSNNGMMLWGNSNHDYNEGTMGWTENGKSDFSWISYQKRGWDNPHVVGYMESHDEERLQFKNITYGRNVSGYNIQDSTIGIERLELAAAFFFTIPGPKMVWQFGEMGYDYSIDFNGRTGEKPIRWDYLDNWHREYLFHVYSALIQLKTEYDVFGTNDFSLDVHNAEKSIVLRNSDMNAVVVGNFGMSTAGVTPSWPNVGTWYEFFTQTQYEVNSTNQTVELERGEYRIYTTQYIEKPEWLNTSVEELKGVASNARFSAYPNPTNGEINFIINLNAAIDINIDVFDAMGKKVAEINRVDLNAGKNQINWDSAGNLEKGIYFAFIRSGYYNESIKFVVE